MTAAAAVLPILFPALVAYVALRFCFRIFRRWTVENGWGCDCPDCNPYDRVDDAGLALIDCPEPLCTFCPCVDCTYLHLTHLDQLDA